MQRERVDENEREMKKKDGDVEFLAQMALACTGPANPLSLHSEILELARAYHMLLFLLMWDKSAT